LKEDDEDSNEEDEDSNEKDEDDEHVHLISCFYFIFNRNIFYKIILCIFFNKKWERGFICAFMRDKWPKHEK